MALEGSEVDDLLIGEVGVKDFGDKDNEDIALRFGATKENFPGLKPLFCNLRIIRIAYRGFGDTSGIY